MEDARQETLQHNPFAGMEFESFCSTYLRIQIRDGSIVPLILNRAQRKMISHLTGRDIVLKARQLGISTAIQALHFYEQMQGFARTNTLCHEDDLTTVIRTMADLFFTELPDDIKPVRKYANAKLTAYEDKNSQGSIATVGGQAGAQKGRGGSMTRIHGSEVAYWPNAGAVMAAAMQAGDPAIVLESTPNGMSGWFYERCMEALDGDSIWTLHFFPWWYDEHYRLPLAKNEVLTFTPNERALADLHGLDTEQINWRRYKLREIPQTFKQEYPEDPISCFLASGVSYFGDIETIFTAPMDAYREHHQYVAGVDFGQADDYTVMIVLDATTRRMVDMLRVNKESWEDMRARIIEKALYWRCEVVAEKNAMGENIEALAKVLGDKLRPFNTDRSSKPPLIQGLYMGFHEMGLRLQPYQILKHELRAFISKQTASGYWQYEAGNGAHDDCVIALALAWHGIWERPQMPQTQTHQVYQLENRGRSGPRDRRAKRPSKRQRPVR